jgi:hypothetical protein
LSESAEAKTVEVAPPEPAASLLVLKAIDELKSEQRSGFLMVMLGIASLGAILYLLRRADGR